MMTTAKNIRPEEKLLSAIVALAIEDVCLAPVKSENRKNLTLSYHAYTAYRFLFEHGDLYLELLNIDPPTFRKRLLRQLLDSRTNRPFDTTDKENFTISRRKRFFRANHKLYHRVETQEIFKELEETDDDVQNSTVC